MNLDTANVHGGSLGRGATEEIIDILNGRAAQRASRPRTRFRQHPSPDSKAKH